MGSVTGNVREWAAEAQKWSVWLLTFLSTALAMAGCVFLYFDVQTSYHGWGQYSQSLIRTGGNSLILAWAVSILPTLLQTAFVVSKTSGIDFVSTNTIFKFISWFSMGFDVVLDVKQLYDPSQGFGSLAMAIVVALLVYTFFSEFLFSFFGPIAVTLLSEMCKTIKWSSIEEGIGGFTPGGRPSSRPVGRARK